MTPESGWVDLYGRWYYIACDVMMDAILASPWTIWGIAAAATACVVRKWPISARLYG
jgi:hypothetical protein